MNKNCFVNNHNNEPVIVKQQGLFFNAYSDSARILAYVTEYKIKQVSQNSQPKCGFPVDALDKVVRILESENVCFKIMKREETVAAFFPEKSNNSEILKRFDENKIVKASRTSADIKYDRSSEHKTGKKNNNKDLLKKIFSFLRMK